MSPEGVYFTNAGPHDGPLLAEDCPGALGVYGAATCLGMPIGIAFPVSRIVGRRGPIKVFRLVVHGADIEGRWILDRRVFVRLGEAAEEI